MARKQAAERAIIASASEVAKRSAKTKKLISRAENAFLSVTGLPHQIRARRVRHDLKKLVGTPLMHSTHTPEGLAGLVSLQIAKIKHNRTYPHQKHLDAIDIATLNRAESVLKQADALVDHKIKGLTPGLVVVGTFWAVVLVALAAFALSPHTANYVFHSLSGYDLPLVRSEALQASGPPFIEPVRSGTEAGGFNKGVQPFKLPGITYKMEPPIK
jgi:hypothetical protein